MNYDFNESKNAQAGVDRLEADWQHYHQLQGAGSSWIETRIRTPYNLPFKKIYCFAYNDQAAATSFCVGILSCRLNNAEVFKMPLAMSAASTPGAFSTLPNTSALLQLGYATGNLAAHPDNIMVSRIGQAVYMDLMPVRLLLSCDEIVFTPIQQGSAAGNACMFLACLSQRKAII